MRLKDVSSQLCKGNPKNFNSINKQEDEGEFFFLALKKCFKLNYVKQEIGYKCNNCQET
jgi:hypothetical protein